MNGADASLTRKLQILLLCVQPSAGAKTIRDHVDAFGRHSRHRVRVLQNLPPLYGSFNGRIPTFPRDLDLEIFDVLVIHYSNFLLSDIHFDASARERIANFRGLKVLFLQDEYRQVDAICTQIRNLGFDVLFTCVPEAEIEKVYPAAKLPGLCRISNLTGYVPEDLLRRKARPLAERPVDVGYRARQVPFWLGNLGAEKWQIAPKFLSATSGSGLKCDVTYREEDRLYGKRWIQFFESCRSVLGSESGASIFDFTGELQQAVERYLAEHPGATFEEIHERFLKEHEGRVRLNQISPRSFEAAALRTAMVLYEGEYSGILVPERHFIPLRKDFSNIDDVVKAIRDTPRLQEMVDRTYREIAASGKYSYRSFIDRFDRVVEREILSRGILSKGKVSAPAALKVRVASAKFTFSTMGFSAWRKLEPMRTRLKELVPSEKWIFKMRILVLRIPVFKFQILDVLLRVGHPIYVRALPESVRARLRPFVRRILSRGP